MGGKMKKLKDVYAQLLICCAFSIALVLLYFSGNQLKRDLDTVKKLDACPLNYHEIEVNDDYLTKNLTPEEKLVVKRYNESFKKAALGKKLHKLNPKNKIYLANRLSHRMYRIEEYRLQEYLDIIFNYQPKLRFLYTRSSILKKIKHAQKIDPNNAFYDYLKAYTLFSQAVVYRDIDAKTKPKSVFKIDLCQVIDEKKLEKAIKAYKAGVKKLYCNNYNLQLTQLRANILYPYPKTFSDFWQKNTIMRAPFVNFNAIMRSLNRKVQTAIIYYYNQKEYVQCEKLIKSWRPFARQLLESSEYQVNILTLRGMAKYNSQIARDYYSARKNHKMAQFYQQKIAELKKFHNYTFNVQKKYRHDLKIYAAPTTKIMFDSFLFLDDSENLKAAFYCDNMVFNKHIELYSLIISFAVLIGIMLFLYFISLLIRKNVFYLQPNFKDFLLLLFGGIIAPLAIYFILTNIDALSGRELNVLKNKVSFNSQCNVMDFGLIIPSALCLFYLTVKQCRKINIDVPKLASTAYLYLILYFVDIILSLFFISYNKPFLTIISNVLLYGLLTFSAIKFIFYAVKYREFLKILYKNVPLYLTIMPLIMFIVLNFTFKLQQCHYINKDTVVYAKMEKGELYTPVEYRGMLKLKQLFKDKILNNRLKK